MKDINVSLTISNDKTVISLVLSSDTEITYDKFSEVLQKHVDLLNSHTSEGVQ